MEEVWEEVFEEVDVGGIVRGYLFGDKVEIDGFWGREIERSLDARGEEDGVEVVMRGEYTSVLLEMWKGWKVEDGVRLDEIRDALQVSDVELQD